MLPTLTVDTPPASVEIGTPVTFTGTISPARPGRRVVLLRLIRGSWKVIAVDGVEASGAYAITHVFRLPSGGVPAQLRIATHRRRVFEPLQVTILRPPHGPSARHQRIMEERRLRHRHAAEERERRRRQKAEARQHRRQLAQERRRHRQQLAEAKHKAEEAKRKAAEAKRKAEEAKHKAEEKRKAREERRKAAEEKRNAAREKLDTAKERRRRAAEEKRKRAEERSSKALRG